MANETDKHENQSIKALYQEVEDIKRRLAPDEIAKAIDRSYLSVNNIRTFLQILSIIMTIFFAGIAIFGFIGIQNILTVQEKIQALSQLENKVSQVENKVSVIQKNLHDISTLFNKIAVANDELLNAREKQLLILLAREIDPNNPVFNFNAAQVAFGFGKYDEALKHVETVFRLSDVPTDIRKRAHELKAKAEKSKANPPEYPDTNKGPAIGDYSILGLHINTLKKLVFEGYLSVQDVNDILVGSMKK